MTISRFVQQLAAFSSTHTLTNPYQPNISKFNDRRRHNLVTYLAQMDSFQPHLLLVGEAPGYRGCRLTGIPFVGHELLCEGHEALGLFGIEAGYQPVEEWTLIRREASSTIVWQSVAQLSTLPLIWNACPFHPHQPGDPQTNRTPKVGEIGLGRPFLRHLLDLFPIKQVVAVGNKAEFALTRWDVPHQKVRHPSHGGKRQFQEQLFALDRKATS